MTFMVPVVFDASRLGVQEKFEFLINHGTTRSLDASCEQSWLREKRLIPDFNTPAYRKGQQR